MARWLALRQSAWLVFAGSLVVFLDFEINGFDLISDVIGAGLVVAGIVKLSSAGLGRRFATPALVASVVWFLLTVPMQVVTLPGLFNWVAGLAGLGTAVFGLLAFRDACRELGLDGAASSWSTSLLLVSWIWGGFALLGAVFAVVNGGEFFYEGPWVIPFVVLAFVPGVHLLMSLKRTASAADRGGVAPPAPSTAPAER